MLDSVSSQFNSYVFWKLPIPELDLSELEGLGIEFPRPSNKPGANGMRSGDSEYGMLKEPKEEDSLVQYNSFNYWRAPIMAVDFDFI